LATHEFKAKMLTFVKLTEKRLVVSLWTFFQISLPPRWSEKTETIKNFCWCRGLAWVSFYSNSFFCFNL